MLIAALGEEMGGGGQERLLPVPTANFWVVGQAFPGPKRPRKEVYGWSHPFLKGCARWPQPPHSFVVVGLSIKFAVAMFSL